MGIKFSEDVVPLTDLKVNPGRIVKHAAEAHRPVLLTSRGRGVAVMQSVSDYEEVEEERAFMRAVVTGLADLGGQGAARTEVVDACHNHPLRGIRGRGFGRNQAMAVKMGSVTNENHLSPTPLRLHPLRTFANTVVSTAGFGISRNGSRAAADCHAI